MLWSGRGIRNEDKKCQHIAVCWQREKSPDVNVQYHHSIWVDNSQAARAKTRIYFWGISPLTGLIRSIRDTFEDAPKQIYDTLNRYRLARVGGKTYEAEKKQT